MKRVGLVVNFRKARGGKILQLLREWFEKRDIQVLMPQCTAQDREFTDLDYLGSELGEQVDMIISLGGDGTLLGTARRTAGTGVPILGVNMGHLGFLTDLEMPDLFPGLERVLRGDYEIEERMMLAIEVRREGLPVARYAALNDAAITKGPLSRIIRLETYVGDEYLATYRADGIIVATPTGSTAYSLSAGGPIVSPDLEVMIVTPICPHTLYARPFIVAERQTIRIIFKSNSTDVMLTIDGQLGFPLQKKDQILVRKAEVRTRLVKLRKRTFFEVLRLKLRESDY
ncbi:MAG: NAD(+)/NADH kinase [Bacillota bacterium]|jgi:NAD+ kinase|nr:NAD(+)/NADH kinase [Bacillota bacterium]